jgi:hypothetical protein
MGNAQPVAGEVTLIRTEQGIAIGPPERNDSSSSDDDDDDSASGESSSSSSSSSEYDEEDSINWWYFSLSGHEQADIIQHMNVRDWELLGRDLLGMSFEELSITSRALDSDEKVSALFRRLMGSNTIKKIYMCNNHFGIQGLRSMVPFLQHVTYLNTLDISGNNIGSEGFAVLWRGLRRSPIRHLICNMCGIESIEIDRYYGRKCGPRIIESFGLDSNFINCDGVREIIKLLHTGGRMTHLSLCNNRIGNEGVAALAEALKNDTWLQTLAIHSNELITDESKVLLLKLVIDVSSIKATLQSNYTLRRVEVAEPRLAFQERDEYHDLIREATDINEEFPYPGNREAVGREKVIRLQLDSYWGEQLADLQGVRRSVYSEIDPLYLPEVLSLIGRRNGKTELFKAVSSTIMTLLHSCARDTEPPRKKRR